jgi:hypothetical protein
MRVFRVADSNHCKADLDPDISFHFNADPDLTFYFHADPDPAPNKSCESATNRLQILHGSIFEHSRPSMVPVRVSKALTLMRIRIQLFALFVTPDPDTG